VTAANGKIRDLHYVTKVLAALNKEVQSVPQSLANVLIHLIFSTKNREPFLGDLELRHGIHAYLTGALQNLECPALTIGGVADHVHILCQLSRKIAIADLVEEVKTGSSKWIKSIEHAVPSFHWQSGYAVFSVSQSNASRVRRYITDQETHHRKRTFQDELRAFLRRHLVEFDERYVWD
jgi:putative transposase